MQIAAEFGYWDKKPALILKAKVPRSANKDKRYIILLDHVWMYSEDHYEQLNSDMPRTYKEYIFAKALELYELFDLGPTPSSWQLSEVAFMVQDAIDSLINMPPYQEMQNSIEAEQEKMRQAKINLKINGETVVGH